MTNIDWEIYGIAKNSSVTQGDISAIERKLRITLPDSYLDLIYYADEATPETSTFAYGGGNTFTCISEFFEFSQENRQYTIIWYADPKRDLGIPDNFIPIARDASDQLICLNYNVNPPTVELFDPNSRKHFHVAIDFEKFVSSWS